jgi:hypothetical protein
MRSPLLAAAVALALAAPALAQVATTQQAAPPAPTLSQIGMFIYPAQDQTPEQQQADEAACTEWAEAQTGLALQAGSVNLDSAAQAAQQQAAQATQGAAVGGAARGAVAGVAIGAIAGDAGKGAAIGAVAGAMGGHRARRAATAQAGQQGAAQAQAQNQQALETFKKAAGACLEARGYSVK